MDPIPIDIRSQSLPALDEWLEKHGQPKYRTGQLWRALHARGIADWQELTEFPLSLREILAGQFALFPISIARMQKAGDNTTKLSLTYHDGSKAECVFLPQKGHSTACLSTQTGCRFGCAFCRTAKMGKGRNLESYEIEAEYHLLSRTVGEKPRNVVFMGMGEPLDNFDNTIAASRTLADPLGANVGFRRITVSTVGITPAICKLAKEEPRVKLALSLISPFQEQREKLTPAAKHYALPDVLDALKFHSRKTHRRPTIEYIILEGINDTREHAQALLDLLTGFPCKINLIAFNNNPDSPFSAPTTVKVLLFQDWLRKGASAVMIRASLGSEISAACGQLAGNC